jgi:hypothetical protein
LYCGRRPVTLAVVHGNHEYNTTNLTCCTNPGAVDMLLHLSSQVTERAARAAAAQSFSCTFTLRSTTENTAQLVATGAAAAAEATVVRAGKQQAFPIAMLSNMPVSASEVLARLQDFAQQQQSFQFRLVDAQTAGESSDSSSSSSSSSSMNSVSRSGTTTAGSATDAEEMAVCDEARTSSSSTTDSAADCIDVSVTVVGDQCTVHAALVPATATAAAVPAAAVLEAFVRLCDSMPGELLRQNRRWRRARMRTDGTTTAIVSSTSSVSTTSTTAATASDGAVAMELSGD